MAEAVLDAPLPLLEQSEEVTRDAISAIVKASPPAAVSIDGVAVSLRARTADGIATIDADWDGGAARFRIQGRPGTVDRRSAADAGHRLGLQITSATTGREITWVSLEWAVRDAVRASRTTFPLRMTNSFLPHQRDEGQALDIAACGARAREVAGRSGLTSETTVGAGEFDMLARSWSPDASTVLGRIVSLALIKAHVQDRGTAQMVTGRPLFGIRTEVQPRAAGSDPASDRLAAVSTMYGRGDTQVDTLVELLGRIRDESPSNELLTFGLQKEHGLSGRRIAFISRLLRAMELARPDDGQWDLLPLGAELMETGDGLVAYGALVRAHIGFEETLAFYIANPGASVEELRVQLNRVLGTGWKTPLQPQRRVYWLASCGLLRANARRYFPTEEGRRVFQSIAVERRAHWAHLADVGEEALEDDDEGMSIIGIDWVHLDPTTVETGDLMLPAGLVEMCCAAINAGKHLLLVGPPGTGKSTLAEALADHAALTQVCEGSVVGTASADWTTYDTIGGWAQQSDGSLAFREGLMTRALRERRWLVLDEVNRADIDKCFGELFTVLAGGTATTAYTRKTDAGEVPVMIGPDATPYTTGPWFRLIATMNVRDKASLFRLSYAFLRRFAVITVPGLPDTALAALAARESGSLGLDDLTSQLAFRALSRGEGLGEFFEVGPSMLRDLLRYAKERPGLPERAVGEGLDLLIFPQLESLEDASAKDADAVLGQLFAADPDSATTVRAAFRANYPHLRFDA